MSLLAAIVEHYDNGTSDDLTALRSLLGSDKMYADSMADSPDRPYCVLGEIQAPPYRETKSSHKRNRIIDVTVAFSVYATGRQQAEDILEAIEDAYLSTDAHFEIEDRTHLATYYGNRISVMEPNGWRGQEELVFRISKSGN